jgi:hypothetical protein
MECGKMKTKKTTTENNKKKNDNRTNDSVRAKMLLLELEKEPERQSGTNKTYLFWNNTEEYYSKISSLKNEERKNFKMLCELVYDNRAAVLEYLSKKK